jgi:hypothetical protein
MTKLKTKKVNPYKVGDLIYYGSYGNRKLARISKVTDSSYWLEFANLRDNVGGFISVKDRLDVLKTDMGYKKVDTEYYDDWRWSLKIPYKFNKNMIVFYPHQYVNTAIRVKQSDITYPGIVLEKDAYYIEEEDLGWN